MRIGLIGADDGTTANVAALLAAFSARVARGARVADALALAVRGEVDLLVYACASWDATSTAACRALSAPAVHAPLLVVVGRRDKRSRVDALRAGADDLIVLPIDVEELAAHAEALVRRSRALQRGPLRVDLVNRRVSVDGQPLVLTTSEYDVVVHLAQRAGAVVPRDDLARAIGAAPRRSNHVAVHVSAIRRKLGRSASMIETVRGAGYRLRLRSDARSDDGR